MSQNGFLAIKAIELYEMLFFGTFSLVLTMIFTLTLKV